MKTSGQIAKLIEQLREQATIEIRGQVTVLDPLKQAAAEALEQLTTPNIFWAHDISLCAYPVQDVGRDIFSWGMHDTKWGKPVRFHRAHKLPDQWAIPSKTGGVTEDGNQWIVSVDWHPSEAEALAALAWPKAAAK